MKQTLRRTLAVYVYLFPDSLLILSLPQPEVMQTTRAMCITVGFYCDGVAVHSLMLAFLLDSRLYESESQEEESLLVERARHYEVSAFQEMFLPIF